MIGKPLILTKENRAASIAGTKKMTRRVITPQPAWEVGKNLHFKLVDGLWRGFLKNKILATPFYKPRYSVGEIVWMQEPYKVNLLNFNLVNGNYLDDSKYFEANLTDAEVKKLDNRKFPYRNTSARFMYKSLARHFFEVTGIKPPHRIQDISEEDCLAEGGWQYGNCPIHKSPAASFITLWDSINEKPKPVIDINKVVVKYVSYPWDDTGKWAKLTTFRGKPHECHPNPWVWPYEYKKVEVEI